MDERIHFILDLMRYLMLNKNRHFFQDKKKSWFETFTSAPATLLPTKCSSLLKTRSPLPDMEPFSHNMRDDFAHFSVSFHVDKGLPLIFPDIQYQRKWSIAARGSFKAACQLVGTSLVRRQIVLLLFFLFSFLLFSNRRLEPMAGCCLINGWVCEADLKKKKLSSLISECRSHCILKWRLSDSLFCSSWFENV